MINFVIRYSDDPKPSSLKSLGTQFVVFFFRVFVVLTSVKLNDQSGLSAVKINDIVIYYLLP